MQIVRDYLLHGPIKVRGKKYAHLCEYFFEICKRVQVGHSCNTALTDVSKAIRNPALQLNGQLLNQSLAIVCDIVHWGLTDYANKRTAMKHKRELQVCARAIPQLSPSPLIVHVDRIGLTVSALML
jgi:hypothetical protein